MMLAVYALRFMEKHYPERLKERYNLNEIQKILWSYSMQLEQNRGC